MQWLLKKISGFFDWWARVTGFPRRYYRIGSKVILVDWGIVGFVVLIWIAMFVFLPWD